MIRTRKKTIVPRTPAQAHYMRELTKNEMIFALGPAGTGKTYIAVAQAVSQLITGSVQRLILSRPAVEAGEKLGFLPGDMKEKVDPYLRPLYDALNDCLPAEQVERRISVGRDRDRADRVHARAHARRRLHHPRRGAEHHARADEDVPDPLRREQPDGDLRRPQPDRSARRRRGVGRGAMRPAGWRGSRASRCAASARATSCATRSSGGSSRRMRGRGCEVDHLLPSLSGRGWGGVGVPTPCSIDSRIARTPPTP